MRLSDKKRQRVKIGSFTGVIAVVLALAAFIYFHSVNNPSNKQDDLQLAEAYAEDVYVKPLDVQEPQDTVHIEMVYVRGGTFTMGCIAGQGGDCYHSEKQTHQVTLSNYYIGKYPVTQKQWQALMGGNNPSHFKGDNLPVENVRWHTVQVFIRRLNEATGKTYRLPTEAEWEYAARGGNKNQGFMYSGSNNLNDVAWHLGNSRNTTHPVGTKKSNELGIYDMNGNVWEWCNDWYGDYSSDAQTNPQGPDSGSFRVMRGGSWLDAARNCRVSPHGYNAPGLRYNDLGFRIALSI